MHVVVTAGHVDHGKSTLVRALTGTDPDRLDEERRRGLTIDLGFAWCDLPGAGPVAFVDVPGHVRFIANMLAGVAVVEAAVLCVDAGEGWREQTEEHLRIVDLAGVRAGVVAITKADRVGAAERDAVRAQVAERTAGTGLAAAPVVACDALSGTGMPAFRRTLATVLAAGPPPAAPSAPSVGPAGPVGPRLWVDRAFTIAGAGTVVTGGVAHGTLATGDRVVVRTARGEVPARIRGIEALGAPVEAAPPGTRAALNLAGVGRADVARGDAVVLPGTWPPVATVDASLTVLAGLGHDVTRRGAHLLYVGAGEHAVRLQVLGATRVAPGETGRVRLRLGRPLPIGPGDRYVLRETGRGETVGGGVVLPPASPAGPAPGALAPGDVAAKTLLDGIEAARPIGLDVATLTPDDKATLARLTSPDEADGASGAAVVVVAGYAVGAGWRDELAGHPAVQRLAADPFAPPPLTPDDAPPDVRRALLRRGLVVAQGGSHFAATALDDAAAVLRGLVADPGREEPGFTVAEARAALGTSRKWAIPLLEALDAAGVTVRRGDRRHLRAPQPAPDG
jgi:selenocysteine-specific elongation factor